LPIFPRIVPQLQVKAPHTGNFQVSTCADRGYCISQPPFTPDNPSLLYHSLASCCTTVLSCKAGAWPLFRCARRCPPKHLAHFSLDGLRAVNIRSLRSRKASCKVPLKSTDSNAMSKYRHRCRRSTRQSETTSRMSPTSSRGVGARLSSFKL